MKLRSCVWKISLFFGVLGSQAMAQGPITIDPRVPPGGGASLPIQSLQFNGSGCPTGVDTTWQVQGDILWLKFPATFEAKSGPNTSVSSSRRNCIASLRFTNSLQTYAIDSLAFLSQLDLPDDSQATARISWFYEGQRPTGSYETSMMGPTSTAWYDLFSSIVSPIWKPCRLDRALNINSEIRLADSYDHASAQLKTVGIRFKRKNCLPIGY